MRVCVNMYESRDVQHKTDFVYTRIVTCWDDAAEFTRLFCQMYVWLQHLHAVIYY